MGGTGELQGPLGGAWRFEAMRSSPQAPSQKTFTWLMTTGPQEPQINQPLLDGSEWGNKYISYSASQPVWILLTLTQRQYPRRHASQLSPSLLLLLLLRCILYSISYGLPPLGRGELRQPFWLGERGRGVCPAHFVCEAITVQRSGAGNPSTRDGWNFSSPAKTVETLVSGP